MLVHRNENASYNFAETTNHPKPFVLPDRKPQPINSKRVGQTSGWGEEENERARGRTTGAGPSGGGGAKEEVAAGEEDVVGSN